MEKVNSFALHLISEGFQFSPLSMILTLLNMGFIENRHHYLEVCSFYPNFEVFFLMSAVKFYKFSLLTDIVIMIFIFPSVSMVIIFIDLHILNQLSSPGG